MKRKDIKINLGIMLMLTAITGYISPPFAGKVSVSAEEISKTEEQISETKTQNSETEKNFSSSEKSAALQSRTISTNELERFPYLLYEPENPTENMPLIVYLHGASGKGDDLSALTISEDFPKFLQDGTFGDLNAYVIIPQLPASQKGWKDISSSLSTLIQETVSEFSIDRTNISLTGFSIGGTAVWELAAEYPSLFARIAPLSGSARGVLEQVTALKELPVWAFCGSLDTVVKPNSSDEMIYKLKKAGADAQIHLFDGADHVSVPALVWQDKTIDLINWLIGADKTPAEGDSV